MSVGPDRRRGLRPWQWLGHDLLKHMAVPRFRLPEVQLEIPVIVEGDLPDASESRGVSYNTASKVFATAFKSRIAAAPVAVPQVVQRAVNTRIGAYLRTATGLVPPVSTFTMADEMASLTMETLSELRPKIAAEFRPHRAALRSDLLRELNVAREDDVRLLVLTNTSSVGVVEDPDRLVRLQLTLSEDALEWTEVPTPTGDKPRLVVE